MIKNIGNNKYKSNLVRSCSVEVRSMSEYPGYGVFALDLIPINTIIEECVVPFDKLSYHNHALMHYKFKGDVSGDVIPLGLAAVLNSDKDPNCVVEQDMNYERILRIKTIKQVLLNEQLTIYY